MTRQTKREAPVQRELDCGVLTKSGDPITRRHKARDSLAAMGIALVPVLVELGIWVDILCLRTSS